MTIDKNSPIALYDQLIDILLKEVGNKQPHEKMLSERQICEKYEVSRTTVRLALQELENMGYIYKRSGKGTFVAEPNIGKQNLLDNYSFTDQMRESGRIPQTVVLLFEVVKSNQFVAGRMRLAQGELVYRIRRLRLADEVPMMVETSYLPVSEFPQLEEELIGRKPLYEIFREDYHQIVKIADEEFSAGLVSEKEASLLKIEDGSPCLKLVRTSYNQKNKIIELTLSTARSDQFIYKVRHVK